LNKLYNWLPLANIIKQQNLEISYDGFAVFIN
jgi:hypothetical protein